MVTYHTYYDETYIIDLSLLFLSPGSGLLLTLQVILGLLELSLQLSLLLLCLGPAGCFFLRSEREGGGEEEGRKGERGREREGEGEREREGSWGRGRGRVHKVLNHTWIMHTVHCKVQIYTIIIICAQFLESF